MCKLDRKQAVFLLVYPLIHTLISIPFFLMMLSTGLGPGDAGDPPITLAQEMASRIGGVAVLILWAPGMVIKRLANLPYWPCQDYLWIALSGFIYAAIFLSLYKLFRHK